MRKTLIVKLSEASEYGNINSNVQPSNYVPACIRTQDTILKPLICEDLFNYVLDLIDLEIDGTPLDVDYDTLINDYIKPYLITEIEKGFIISNNNKITAKGTGKISDEFERANEIAQNKILIDQTNKYATSYRNSLVKFLEDNSDTYPLYKECGCTDKEKKASSYSNSFSIL